MTIFHDLILLKKARLDPFPQKTRVRFDPLYGSTSNLNRETPRSAQLIHFTSDNCFSMIARAVPPTSSSKVE